MGDWNVSSVSLKENFVQTVIWYDYFGVSQPLVFVAESDQHTDLMNDMGKAVYSIPANVEVIDHFIVLALRARWCVLQLISCLICVLVKDVLKHGEIEQCGNNMYQIKQNPGLEPCSGDYEDIEMPWGVDPGEKFPGRVE